MAEGGRIINFSTGGTFTGAAYGSIYLGAKAAVEQLTKALAHELAPKGITVNTASFFFELNVADFSQDFSRFH